METKKTNSPNLTALKRKRISMPVRHLINKNLLQGRILDFGCGYGYEADKLKEKGYDITGYDKYIRPEIPQGQFDTIICNFVLDVIEPEEQHEVLEQVINLLQPTGKAYFIVRRDIEEEGFQMHSSRQGYIYQADVHLPYESIRCNESYEIYCFQNSSKKYKHPHECVFCNIASNTELIAESVTCISFYDAHPVSPGHSLIIPRRHISSYFDLTDNERMAMNDMLMTVKQKLDSQFHPDGYNIGINENVAAGQTVSHLHMHIIPRYTGDVDDPRGGIRAVIPGKQVYSAEDFNSSSEGTHKKAYTYEEKRERYGNAFLPWEQEADDLLIKMYVEEGKSIELLSEIFERTPRAIQSRLEKLGIIEEQ